MAFKPVNYVPPPALHTPHAPHQPSSLFFDTSSSLSDHDPALRHHLSTLITASHILHHHSVLDAYGHISLRNPSNASTFFLPRNLAPALIRNGSDIVEYHVSDASPVAGSAAPHGYAERAIHAALYKRWTGVNAVVHAHDPEVVPWSLVVSDSDTDEDQMKEHGLAAVTHMAGFLGTGVPVWDIAQVYKERAEANGGKMKEGERQDLLVKDVAMGASLAKAFARGGGGGGGGGGAAGVGVGEAQLKSEPQSGTTSPTTTSSQTPLPLPRPSSTPPHSVVLMRGHGYTSTAPTLHQLVYQSIYLQLNARIQSRASALACEAGRGKNKIHFLSAAEAHDAKETMQGTIARCWELWEREVEVEKLYRNELKWDEEEEDDAKRRREAIARMGKRDSVASTHSVRSHSHLGPMDGQGVGRSAASMGLGDGRVSMDLGAPISRPTAKQVVNRALEREKEEAAAAERAGSRKGSWVQSLTDLLDVS